MRLTKRQLRREVEYLRKRLEYLREESSRPEEALDRFVTGTELLIAQHKPEINEWDFKPGNSRSAVPFYCSLCRTPWPCREVNDLRWLYGETNEWPAAKRPYTPLTLNTAEPKEDSLDD